MTQLTATFTVTIKTKPDGDYYFDHDDLVRNAVPWIEGGLDDRDDIAEVTITEQPAAVSAPAGQTTLRDRIAAALTAEHYRRAEARIVASPEEHCAAMADAVLAVLPEPADRAAVEAERDALGREADRLRKDWVEMRTRAEQAEAEVERLRAARAASLQEAAALLHQRASSIDALSSSDFGEEARAVGELAEAAETLRRMADETATTEGHRLDPADEALENAMAAGAYDEPAAGARQDGAQS